MISTDWLHYNKESKTFSAEISSLDAKIGIDVTVQNPKTGNKMKFHFHRKDVDGTGEDVYGWWYKSEEGYLLLIIND